MTIGVPTAPKETGVLWIIIPISTAANAGKPMATSKGAAIAAGVPKPEAPSIWFLAEGDDRKKLIYYLKPDESFDFVELKNDVKIIAAGNDKLFENLCKALDLNELINDEKFKVNSSRSENMDTLKKIIEKKLVNKTTNNWVKIFENLKIPCGPIFNIKEAVENPQVKARNMIVKAYHKVIGEFKLAGNPIKMSSYKDENKRGDIPDLDEHRNKILKEFS